MAKDELSCTLTVGSDRSLLRSHVVWQYESGRYRQSLNCNKLVHIIRRLLSQGPRRALIPYVRTRAATVNADAASCLSCAWGTGDFTILLNTGDSETNTTPCYFVGFRHAAFFSVGEFFATAVDFVAEALIREILQDLHLLTVIDQSCCSAAPPEQDASFLLVW